MKWIVGIDRRQDSHGPLCFAAWLCSRAPSKDPDRVIGLHVLEDAELRTALRMAGLPEVQGETLARTRAAVEASGLSRYVSEVFVLEGGHAEQALAAAVDLHGGDGLILGRQARRESARLVRLGKVARRLLRIMPASVFVVPPDLELEHLGHGPIVVGVAPRASCLPAILYAQALGARVDRELLLVHAVALPELFGDYGPALDWERIVADVRRDAERELIDWLASHRLDGLRREILDGDPVDVLTGIATREKSPLVVVGSRRLSALERLFVSSVGSALAGSSSTPVAVVPRTTD